MKKIKKIHSIFSKNSKWYKDWHSGKFHKPFHVFLFVLFLLSVVLGVFVRPYQTEAALVSSAITKTTESDFNEGTLSDAVVQNASGGEVGMQVGKKVLTTATSTASNIGAYSNLDSIVRDSTGRLHVVWGEYTAPYKTYYIYSDDEGDTWSSPYELFSDSLYRLYQPWIKIDGNDRIHVMTYRARSDYGTIWHKYKDLGGSWSSRITIGGSHSSNEVYFMANPGMAENNSMYLGHARLHLKGTGLKIWGGSSWGGTQAVEGGTGDHAYQSTKVIGSNLYYFYRKVASPNPLMFTRRVGGTWYPSIQIGGSFASHYHDEVIDNDGNIWVFMTDSTSSVKKLYYRKYTVSTNTWGSLTLLDSDPTYHVQLPSGAVDSSGNVYVLYNRYNVDGANVVYKTIDPAVGVWSSAQTITDNTTSDGNCYWPKARDQYYHHVEPDKIEFTCRQSDVGGTTYRLMYATLGGSTTGTYTSPESGASVINTNYNGGWDTTAFEASATIPENTSLQLEMRSGAGPDANTITWNSWQDMGTTTYNGSNERSIVVDSASMPNSTDLPIGESKYLQVRATLNSLDGEATPTLKDYSINYMADENAPTNPDSATVRVEDGGSEISSGDWTSETTPYITFSGASDGAGESGIDGYHVYFGNDPTADPETAGDWVDYGSEVYEPTLSSPTSPDEYYLRIDTVDIAGNKTDMPSGSYIYSYQFDNVDPSDPTNVEKVPVGYTSTNSYSFDWTDYAGSDVLPGSDVCSYEYKTDDVGSDWQSTTNTAVAGAFAYQNDENIFRVRTVDCAGNKSSGNMFVRFYFSQDAPGVVQSLAVDPGSNTDNSFSFSWDKPLDGTYNGYIKYYHYSINNPPTTEDHQEIEVAIDHTSATLPADAYATNQGLNTLYVVAVDDSGNVAYDSDHWETIQFECNTEAPGIPVRVNVIDTSDREVEDWSLTLKWQAPATGGAVHHYDIYRSDDGGISYNYRGSATTTTYSEAGLSNLLEYKYKVYAVDNASSASAASQIVTDTPTGRYTSPPAVVTGPEVTATAIGAVVTWSTDREASSFVEYSVDGSYSLSNGSLTPKTSHSVELSGLSPSTTYNFRIQSLDEERDYQPSEAYSGNYTLVTSAAPGISEVEVSDIGLNSAIVTWKTTSSATSTIKYGTTTAYGQEVTDESGSQVTKHTIKLSDLNHSTNYNFKIYGKDIDNNYMESDNYVFQTLIFPRVSNVRFEQQKETATSTLEVTWESNVPLTSIVEYSPAAGGATKEFSSSKLKNKHEVMVSGLKDNTDYIMSVKGRDAYGNLASSDANRVRTDFDTRPPEILNIATETEVTGFGVDAKGQIVVSWETDEPATSQVEYATGSQGADYSSKTQIDTSLTTSHVVIISDLKTSSPYHFRIISEDASENTAYSADHSTLTGQATESILDVLIKSLESTIGWLFNY